MNKGRQNHIESENVQSETDIQEGIAGGLCYIDSAGINLQVGTQVCEFHLLIIKQYLSLNRNISCRLHEAKIN